MSQLSIPTCYFPSTVIFLDDNRDFLLNFVLQLDENVAYRIFDDPYRTLDYLNNKRCEFDALSQAWFGKNQAQDTPLQSLLEQGIAAIHAEVLNPHRFSEISVVVVDYAMPKMNGLEFCRRIENANIKKILLTGQADEKLAIEAFNEGVIDRYIKKSDVNAAELITKNIYDLQKQYFLNMSDAILRLLAFSYPKSLLDKDFIGFFNQFIQEQSIVEYYLADQVGSFFMLDSDANTSFMIVKTQEQMGADKASERMQLTTNQKWQTNSFALQTAQNEPCIVPAKRITDNSNYYFAYLQSNGQYDIRASKILSYNRYLEELDAEELLNNPHELE